MKDLLLALHPFQQQSLPFDTSSTKPASSGSTGTAGGSASSSAVIRNDAMAASVSTGSTRSMGSGMPVGADYKVVPIGNAELKHDFLINLTEELLEPSSLTHLTRTYENRPGIGFKAAVWDSYSALHPSADSLNLRFIRGASAIIWLISDNISP